MSFATVYRESPREIARLAGIAETEVEAWKHNIGNVRIDTLPLRLLINLVIYGRTSGNRDFGNIAQVLDHFGVAPPHPLRSPWTAGMVCKVLE
jgi:hypothetical protein